MTIRFTGTKEFERDLKKFARTTRIAADQVARNLTFDIFDGVVERNPVDTGWSRANWLVGTNVRPEGVPVPKPAENNVLPPPKFPGVLPNPNSAVYWVVNNIPYIIPLEEGRSKQIGKGFMVRRTLVATQARLRKILRDVES